MYDFSAHQEQYNEPLHQRGAFPRHGSHKRTTVNVTVVGSGPTLNYCNQLNFVV